MIFSETNKEISAALAKSWAEIENPKHNKTVQVKTKSGGQYTFDYADLGTIFDEAKRVFKENGISILQISQKCIPSIGFFFRTELLQIEEQKRTVGRAARYLL